MSKVILPDWLVVSLCEQLRGGDTESVLGSLAKALESAEEDDYASVAWSVDDILSRAYALGVDLTEDEARSLLEQEEGTIINDMTSRGWETIDECLFKFERGK